MTANFWNTQNIIVLSAGMLAFSTGTAAGLYLLKKSNSSNETSAPRSELVEAKKPAPIVPEETIDQSEKIQESAEPQENEAVDKAEDQVVETITEDLVTKEENTDTPVDPITAEHKTESGLPDRLPGKIPGATKESNSYTELPSGLKYREIKPGDGSQNPTKQSLVTVHYEGRLEDGTVFDSSIARGQPTSFKLSHVIAGWTEGVQLMSPGARYQFLIPHNLAYGKAGNSVIPAMATLTFEIELLSIN